MTKRMVVAFVGLLLVIVGCSKSSESRAPEAKPAAAASGAYVGGTVGFVPPGENETEIVLHDFEVELRSGRSVIAKAMTDEFGRFVFPGVPRGTYKVCWKQIGWTTGCASNDVILGDSIVDVPVEVRPDPATGGYVWGKVTFGDGRPAAYSDALFAVHDFASVSANVGQKTRVNAVGEYGLVGLPATAKSITATFGAATATQPISVTPAGTKVSIPFENRPPRALALAAQENAFSFKFGDVHAASPGEVVSLDAGATDIDGDTLTYRWHVPVGEIIGQAAATVRWKAPQRPGRYVLDVLTSDGKGGYNRKSITVFVRPTEKAAAFNKAAALVGAACPSVTEYFPCPTPPPPLGCPNPNTGWLTFKSNDEAAAKTYYDNVGKDRLTLSDWFTLAGFGTGGTGGERAQYTNDNDLGFGRDMHIIQTSKGTFAYVTNYLNGCTLQDPKNAELATTANPNDAIATVCMEYSSATYDLTNPGGTDRIVKFFVYNGAGERQTSAVLDTTGAQPIPGLCLNCHGGVNYDSSKPNVVDLKARFLPFDLDTYKYYPASNTQYTQFHNLNKLVAGTFPVISPPLPTVALIDGWYAGGTDTPDTTFAPGDWNDPQHTGRKKVYQRVVARSCRTCHVAFDTIGKPTWATWAEFSNATNRKKIKSYVNNGLMPHALITYTNFWSKNFWTDGTGPAVLNCFINNPVESDMETCLANVP